MFAEWNSGFIMPFIAALVSTGIERISITLGFVPLAFGVLVVITAFWKRLNGLRAQGSVSRM